MQGGVNLGTTKWAGLQHWQTNMLSVIQNRCGRHREKTSFTCPKWSLQQGSQQAENVPAALATGQAVHAESFVCRAKRNVEKPVILKTHKSTTCCEHAALASYWQSSMLFSQKMSGSVQISHLISGCATQTRFGLMNVRWCRGL